jgi:hypothetical protein
MSDPANPTHVEWNDFSELHEKRDGGGLFSGLKAIRQGTLADLVHFVVSLPEADREQYVIEKSGDHQLDLGEIMRLSRRPDYPHA